MPDRPDSVPKKVRQLSTQPIVQYRELKQVILELLKTLSISTDPALQYYALRSFLSIAISVLDGEKYFQLVKRCKEALEKEIELPSVDLRYEMHPNTAREIYTFQVDEKTIKVSSEVFVPTFQMIERFLYRQHYIRYASLVVDVLKVLVEEGKVPWEMQLSFKLGSISLGEEMSTGGITIFESRPEFEEGEEIEEEGEEEYGSE